jgi:hypothetical protein
MFSTRAAHTLFQPARVCRHGSKLRKQRFALFVIHRPPIVRSTSEKSHNSLPWYVSGTPGEVNVMRHTERL